MHRAKLKRIVACVLAFVIFLTGSQFDLFAHAAGDPPYIKKELEQYRTEFSKTYLKSDGGLESVVSPSALHFKNEKGEWEEIDQTLVLKTEDGQKVYETKNSPMTVRFPAELNSSDTGVTLEAEGHKIVVELLDNKNSKASKKEKEKQSERSGRPKSKMIASELLEQEVTDSSAIEYADVYSGADLRYDTTAGSLKESVILKDRQNGNRTYRYNITADGLELRLESDGRVEFYEPSSAEPVFTMPAPLMFDAEEEYSYDIDVKLKQKKGVYELSYTPDKDWLNDQERVYPVTLDPSIVVNSGVEDSYTYSAADYQNSYLGFEKQLKVGGSVWQGSNDTFDTYIKFKELPQIPAEEYTLDSALLMVTPKSFAGYWSEMKVGAFEITEDWTNEYTGQSGDFISYANRPASSDMTFSTATFTYGDTAAGGFEVANLVEKWYNEAGTNYGVRLSAVSATDNPWNCLIFHSSRSDTGRPYLSITYTPIIEATGITITNRPENDCVELMSSLPSYKLEAELSPEEATPEEIVWESSDTEVADIAADGTVWPHKTGTTIISVKLKDRQEIRDSFALSFYNTPVESLTIKGRPSDDTITRTYTLKLTADIYPLNASVDKIEWSSSDPSVATVDENGLCTGVSGGTTTITAKAGSVTDSFLLTVKRTSVIVVNGPSGWEMIEGQTFEHFLTQTWPLTDDEIVYTSSDPSVATVNGTIIKALKAGTTTIRAELANDSSIYVEEELLVKPGGYALNLPPNNYLVVGQSWKLTDDPDVKIEVGNQPKIKVESGGIITAVESGETTLETWKGYRGDFRRIELVIGLSDLGITGRPSNDRMEVGDIHQGLSVSISNPYDEDIVWSTSDESVATVDCDFLNGTRIYAHNEGVTIISAYIPEINTSASFTLTVSPKKVNSVVIHDDFKPENDTIYLSEEITLGAQVTPADATYDKVDWSTQSINNGLVYIYPTYGTNARRTIKVSGQHTGQVKFTAYAGGVSSAPYTITIKELEAEITNLPAGNKMTVGQTHQLGKIIGPSDASVKWDSQNKNVATVDSNGKITALSAGTTIISIAVSKFQITETSAFTLTVTENYENPEICPLVINNAIYYIKNLSGKYLDVYNGNTTDGTRLLQYNFSGSENQRFKIQHISGAEYKIIPQNATNKVLSVNGSKHVVLETENGSSCQRWYIFNRNGNVQIVNKQYNQCPLEISSTDNYVCVGNTTNYDTWQLEVQSYPLELFGVEQVKISHLQTENGYHLYIYILKNNKTSEYTALINSSSNEEFEVYNINEETKEKMDAAWAGYSNGTYENNSFEEYCGGARLALDYGNLKLPSNISRTSDEYYAAWLYVTGLNEKAYEQFINDLPYVVTGIVLTFATISITFYALDNMAYNAAVNTSQVLNQNQTNQIASKVSEKIGTYSSSTLNRVLQMCIRNPSSKNVVLGMSESTNPYYKVAETLKFNHFFTNQWDKLVSQYGRHFMDIVNMHYLELQKARDCIFYLSSDPNSKTITHGFAMEIQWLIQQGYHFTKTIIDGIELWIATK